MSKYKNWGDLNFDERAEVLEAFQNTEDRNESDKVAPREEDVKDYYEDNFEKFGFVAHSGSKKPICFLCGEDIEPWENAMNKGVWICEDCYQGFGRRA